MCTFGTIESESFNTISFSPPAPKFSLFLEYEISKYSLILSSSFPKTHSLPPYSSLYFRLLTFIFLFSSSTHKLKKLHYCYSAVKRTVENILERVESACKCKAKESSKIYICMPQESWIPSTFLPSNPNPTPTFRDLFVYALAGATEKQSVAPLEGFK